MLAALATVQGDVALESRVNAALAKMSLEEKVDLIGGVDGFYVRAVPEAGLPRLKMSDGPVGVRNDGSTTAYPAGFTLAATWDADLANRFGTAIGRDARARGVHIWLGPGINPARIVQNGRNFEYLGEDPLLIGRMATGIVRGVQSQGVVATVKHFAGNEHENDRNNDDSIIDERALREIYLKPFETVVKEGKVRAVMTSYNLVNGQHMSENERLLFDTLKGTWGFDGIVMSDWVSTYSLRGPYYYGLDLEMPSPRYMNRRNLLPLLSSGELPQGPLNDKVRRILRVALGMDWDKRPQKDDSIPLDDPQNAASAIQVAREGMILLKNRDRVLPLSKSTQRILVVGPNADPAVTGGGGSAYTNPFRSVSVRDALQRLAPSGTMIDYTPGYSNPTIAAATTEWTTPDGSPGVKAEYFAGVDLQGGPVLARTEPRIDNRWGNGTPDPAVPKSFSARWTGRYTPKESGDAQIVVGTDDGMRVYVDGKKVIDAWQDQGETTYRAPLSLTAGKPVDVVVEYYQRAGEAVARVGISGSLQASLERDLPEQRVEGADAVVACVGFNSRTEGEGEDRPWELPAEQVAMLKRLIALNKRVIVVLNAGAGVATKEWIDGAAGFIDAGYPGGEGNLALAEILYGRTSPSGKLPTTFPAEIAGTYYADAYPPVDHRQVYKEGIFMGYRWFDKNAVAPLFPFGYGLSYSTFKLSLAKPTPAMGGNATTVQVVVKNTGRMAAAETVQLYAEPPSGDVSRAPRELRAFQRVPLEPGESKTIALSFDNKDLARYEPDPNAWGRGRWIVDAGDYKLRIGTSSRDLPLTVTVKVRDRVESRVAGSVPRPR